MEKKSSIIAIGLTVHQTPVQIREQLSIAEVSSFTGCLHFAWEDVPCHSHLLRCAGSRVLAAAQRQWDSGLIVQCAAHRLQL